MYIDAAKLVSNMLRLSSIRVYVLLDSKFEKEVALPIAPLPSRQGAGKNEEYANVFLRLSLSLLMHTRFLNKFMYR